MHSYLEQSSQNENLRLASPLLGSVLERKIPEEFTFFGSKRVKKKHIHLEEGSDKMKNQGPAC